MKMKSNAIALLVFLCFSSGIAFASGNKGTTIAGVLEIDLASGIGSDSGINIPGRYRVDIKNYAGKGNYSIAIDRGYIERDGLKRPDKSGLDSSSAENGDPDNKPEDKIAALLSSECGDISKELLAPLSSARDTLKKAIDPSGFGELKEKGTAIEAKVVAAILDWENTLINFKKNSATCYPVFIKQQAFKVLKNEVRIIKSNTLETKYFNLHQGEIVTVTIKRKFDDYTWVYKYNSGSRGKWLTTTGFLIIPNNDKEYFSKENANGTFNITRKKNQDDYDPALGIFYTWISGKQMHHLNYRFGPTAGLGIDTNDFVVFAGATMFINDNVSFTLGPIVHKQKRLEGEFKLNQDIKESLSNDALTEDVYKLNYFAAVTFRFK